MAGAPDAVRAAFADAAMGAFEVSGLPAALLDRRGQVVRLNEPAKALLGVELSLVGRRLASSNKEATAALSVALKALLSEHRTSAVLAPVGLPRAGHCPLLAYPVRLAASQSDLSFVCQPFLIFIDVDARRSPTPALLTSLLRLTPAEARLGARLATGEALEAAAEALGISKDTAKTQLSSIFAKTGAHRQAELVVLFSRLCTICS
jgi:DNA-binding CsgD family transcriptional regulator